MFRSGMKALTSRERLTRIFRGEEIDRPALKLWGFGPCQGMLHPDYESVYRKAAELSDWFAGADSPFYLAGWQNYEKLVTYDYKPLSKLWKELVITYHTPKGNLT